MNSIESQQQQLLAAIFNCRIQDQFDKNGLAIYRANLRATAKQALCITFPTIHSLLGDEWLASITEQLLTREATSSGNWATWGTLMPKLLGDIPELQPFPFLPDCAQLDYLCHQMARRENNYTDMDSLMLLQSEEPRHLKLDLNPTLEIITSAYPIAEIRWAHLQTELAPRAALKDLSSLMRQQNQFHLICFKDGLQVRVESISAPEHQWLLDINSLTLDQALNTVRDEDFSFQEWLLRGVQTNLLRRVQRVTESNRT